MPIRCLTTFSEGNIYGARSKSCVGPEGILSSELLESKRCEDWLSFSLQCSVPTLAFLVSIALYACVEKLLCGQ